jgi:hypothetical protein
MANKAECPNCGTKVKVPGYIAQALIRCPRCAEMFKTHPTLGPWQPWPEAQKTKSQPTAEERPIAPPQPAHPTLTSPHRCQHCRWLIQSHIGQRRATVVCPKCSYKTSVYAVIYSCSDCGLSLESPSELAGRETCCPGCGRYVTVPHDVLLAERPVGADDSFFSCECPSCSECLVAKKEDVGVGAVCPHCLVVMTVPSWGEHLEGIKPEGLRDPMESLHESKSVQCPTCHTWIPGRAEACPMCGTKSQ